MHYIRQIAFDAFIWVACFSATTDTSNVYITLLVRTLRIIFMKENIFSPNIKKYLTYKRIGGVSFQRVKLKPHHQKSVP